MRIWSHLLKKSLMENTIFCAVTVMLDCFKDFDFRMMDILLLLLLYLSLLHSYYYYYYYYPLYHSIIAIFDLLSLWFFFRFTYICPLSFNVTSLWICKANQKNGTYMELTRPSYLGQRMASFARAPSLAEHKFAGVLKCHDSTSN